MKRGKFIVIEGINASGKTEQQNALHSKLQSLGIPVIKTAEPTHDLPIGNIIRNKYLNGKRKADKVVFAYLYAADRYDQIINPDDGIIKTLREGTSIIQSRNYLSSVAMEADEDNAEYGMEWICKLNDVSCNILKPDIIIYINILPEEAIERQHDHDFNDTFEDDDGIRRSYRQYTKAIDYIQKRNNENIVVVDGNKSKREVEEEIWKVVKDLF